MRLTGHAAHMGEKRDEYRILVRNPEGRKPVGKPRRRCEDLSGSGKGPVKDSCEHG
jgi:hypothetical protein